MSLAENLSKRDFPLLIYFKPEPVNVNTNKLGLSLGPNGAESLEHVQTNEHPKTGFPLVNFGGTGQRSSSEFLGVDQGVVMRKSV